MTKKNETPDKQHHPSRIDWTLILVALATGLPELIAAFGL